MESANPQSDANANLMECPKCGAKVLRWASPCVHCGAPFAALSFTLRAPDPKKLTQAANKALLKICKAIAASNSLSDEKLGLLREWISQRPLVTTEGPGNVISEKLVRIFADPAVDDLKRADLLRTIHELAGAGHEEIN